MTSFLIHYSLSILFTHFVSFSAASENRLCTLNLLLLYPLSSFGTVTILFTISYTSMAQHDKGTFALIWVGNVIYFMSFMTTFFFCLPHQRGWLKLRCIINKELNHCIYLICNSHSACATTHTRRTQYTQLNNYTALSETFLVAQNRENNDTKIVTRVMLYSLARFSS